MPRAALRAPRAARLPLLAAVLALAAGTACGGDDGVPPIDGPAAVDAASVCNLPAAVITCTAGDNSPCTAVCDTSYCHLFNQVGTICTKACAVVEDCPSGWSCNTMGRCRPP